jgi:hypothetical protein
MPTKERFQNPTIGDTVNLRLFTYNSNNRRSVKEITEINIYTIDETLRSVSNPEGLRLVETLPGSSVVTESTGQYLLPLFIDDNLYTIGNYHDVWDVVFENGENATAHIRNNFQIYSDLWFTSPLPPIYDFNFNFRPNRFRKGSKRYILIQVTPNVPKGSDILPYYENLAIVSDLRVSIEQACGDCLPAEQDLRLLIDKQLVDYREKGYGYYFLDTNLFDEGIYNIWFEITLGESTFVSEKNAFQIFS